MVREFNIDTTASELSKVYADEIKGKVILATGVTAGSIGAAYVENIARSSPRLIILAGRSADKLKEEADRIESQSPGTETRSLVLDLSSQKNVRRAAEEVLSWDDVPHIDVVCACAGVMAVPYKLTEDGIEHHFAMNHLGHFLLVNLIMDKILAAPAPRVISVSSDGHRLNPGIRFADYNFDNGYNGSMAYGQSKTANALFALSLAKLLGKRGLLSFTLHPGVILTTGITSALPKDDPLTEAVNVDHQLGYYKGDFPNVPVSVDQGAATQFYASFEPSLKDHNGAWLQESRLGNPYTDLIKPWVLSEVEADKLWTLSEELVGQKFQY
jgi:NAD(P)-dependent dehydrogenase (short-subunit alcohol dehydrogenase family)